MKNRKDKVYAVLMLVFLLIQMAPILFLGQYNHPTSDDYHYGTMGHHALMQGGNLGDVIEAAVEGVKLTYYTWQGSYAAVFVMRFEPHQFGEQYYSLVPWIMLSVLCIGTIYFMRTLWYVVFDSDSWNYLSASGVVLTLCIQLSLVPAEQFFWYTGAVYYDFFYSILLLYVAWMIRFLHGGGKRYVVYMALGTVVVAGGNFVTALGLGMLIVLITAVKILLSGFSDPAVKKRTLVMAFLFIEYLVAFLISILAPGNSVRESAAGGYGPVSTIIHALIQGTNYYFVWINKWWILAALMMLPGMFALLRKTTFNFAYPGLVMLFSYGFFCALSCPPFYGLGNTGPGRLVNIIYDTFLIITFIQLFYLLGYVRRKLSEHQVVFPEQIQAWGKNMLILACGLILAFGLISGNFTEMTTFRAAKVIYKGEAAAYDAEYKQRLEVLLDDSVEDVVFTPFIAQPDLVYIADAIDDPDFINNTEQADYYDKKSLVVK